MATFRLKRHDTYPPLGYTVKDSDAALLDMTDAIVKFTMTNKATDVVKIDRAVGEVDALGHIRYIWVAVNTDTVGSFLAEFEVTLSTGKKFTVPNNSSLTVVIEEDLDNV